MPLDIRRWTCPACGEVHDRDINEAINIPRVDIPTLGIDGIRLAMQAAGDDTRIPVL